MVAEFDEDGDGAIDFEEFLVMMDMVRTAATARCDPGRSSRCNDLGARACPPQLGWNETVDEKEMVRAQTLLLGGRLRGCCALRFYPRIVTALCFSFVQKKLRVSFYGQSSLCRWMEDDSSAHGSRNVCCTH